jgi:hypothetical protein
MQRRKNSHQNRRCRDCRFCGPSKRCLDLAIRSGRCGDWVWYVRGSKQCRRRYARPKDPRTVAQLLNRGRFRTASKRYHRVLTDEQQDACIAAGAKARSRPRLGQSGPLTGQQYWIRKDATQANAGVKIKSLKTMPQVLQPQRVTQSTSGIQRGMSRVSPEQRRLKARPADNNECRGQKEGCRKQEARAASKALQNQSVTGSGRGQCRRTAGVRPVRVGLHSGGSSLLRGLRARRRSWGIRTTLRKVLVRRQRGLAWRRRTQPEQVGMSQEATR